MKKTICLLLAFVLTLALAGCAAPEEPLDSSSLPESISESVSESISEPESESESESEPEPVQLVIQYAVPEGFIPVEQLGKNDDYRSYPEYPEEELVPGLYCSPDYPDDIANFIFSESEPDPYFDQYTVDVMESAMEYALEDVLDPMTPSVKVSELEYYEVMGVPAYRMRMSYVYSDMLLDQWVVCVNADKCYTFTYTQMAETGWDDAFETSIASICFTEVTKHS